ncbi:MAG: CarD family transcriptional regulator [Gammaproteobacteria bacterium]|nr:CarD family transcriptional regulator [Gammaproteobacteria bacterium]
MPKVLDYEIGEYVVYPSHGVGKVTAIEDQIIGDLKLKMFVVVFDKEKMKLRVPVDKTSGSGMRRLSSTSKMDQAISTLKGKARQRRVMWSRRAQEYEAKLHSGDPIAIAEVIRDLFRNDEQPEQSYSERQMYEAALERLAREYAALENTDTVDATERLEEVLRTA